MRNSNFLAAKINKNDKFFTQLVDIEKELSHYTDQFKGKVIYCNCDTEESNFVKYFRNNKTIKKLLYSSNDFRDNIELLKQADIVVTNPPFSLFREYITQLIEYKKKFLIVGHQNAITYKEIFPLIKDNKIWLGVNNNQSFVFETPYENTLEANKKFCQQKGFTDDNYVKVPGINWYTNLPHKKRNEELILTRKYKGNEKDYPKYDNYDAINVDKVKDIPGDYKGFMGVPITFLDKFNPKQFDIIGNGQTMANELGIKPIGQKFVDDYYTQGNKGSINAKWNNLVYHIGKKVCIPYQRILIKHRKS